MNRPQAQIPPDLRKLVDFLDTRIQGPMGFRFGWDGIIGLIPGVGDVMTGAMSLYVILRSAALGAPASVLLRMGGNVFVENIIDMVPLLGNIFDFFWKSNSKNLRLLESYVSHPQKTTVQSRVWVALAVILIFAVVIGLVSLSLFILGSIWEMLSNNNTGGWTV